MLWLGPRGCVTKSLVCEWLGLTYLCVGMLACCFHRRPSAAAVGALDTHRTSRIGPETVIGEETSIGPESMYDMPQCSPSVACSTPRSVGLGQRCDTLLPASQPAGIVDQQLNDDDSSPQRSLGVCNMS